jgi:hypothetical protein
MIASGRSTDGRPISSPMLTRPTTASATAHTPGSDEAFIAVLGSGAGPIAAAERDGGAAAFPVLFSRRADFAARTELATRADCLGRETVFARVGFLTRVGFFIRIVSSLVEVSDP